MKSLILNQFEVEALLEKRKKRFSVPFSKKYIINDNPNRYKLVNFDGDCAYFEDLEPEITPWLTPIPCPYPIGELIYVREAWRLLKAGYIALNRGFGHSSMPSQYEYKANSEKTGPWKSPVTMPKSAARIFLKVVDVKRMRVQDMTEDEAVHEGIERFKDKSGFKIGYKNYYKEGEAEKTVAYGSPRKSFQSLHIKKHGLDSWNNNAWIFSFEVERVTI
jgi:hypothetical protein